MYGRTVSVRSARCNCICDGSLRVCVVRICPYQMGIWSLYITTFSVCVYASVYVSGGVVVCACVSWCGCHSGVRVSGRGYWRVSSYVQMCLGMGALAACVCGISGKILDSAFVVCVYDGVRGYVYVGGCGGMGWSVNMRVCKYVHTFATPFDHSMSKKSFFIRRNRGPCSFSSFRTALRFQIRRNPRIR